MKPHWEIIVCYSHSTLRTMWSDRSTRVWLNLIFWPKGHNLLSFPVSDVAVISVEELGLTVSNVGFNKKILCPSAFPFSSENKYPRFQCPSLPSSKAHLYCKVKQEAHRRDCPDNTLSLQITWLVTSSLKNQGRETHLLAVLNAPVTLFKCQSW